MTTRLPIQCDVCAWKTTTTTCQAFPDGIPRDILGGLFDHTQPHPGDNGITFRPRDRQDPTSDQAHLESSAKVREMMQSGGFGPK